MKEAAATTPTSFASSSASASDYAPRQAASWTSTSGSGFGESSISDFWMPVLSASLLITGNTFGAGSLVLPQLAQQPGLAASSGVFVGAYLMNLLSGLIIAEVAIQQKENSGTEVPSSFKELVEENLKSPTLATVISVVSFCVNALVFSFDMSRVGIVAEQLSAGLVNASTMSLLWGTSLVTLLTTQSSQRISNIASVCVSVLFASFGSLLLPGLAHTDPMAAWTNPGLAAEPMAALGDLAPVILMAMIYQNIVPTITRLHNYDRAKTVTSMVIGSAIPLAMYLAWCVACLGGGIDLTRFGMENGPLLAVFSLATLAGSSIGCGLSCASELETFMDKQEGEDDSVIVVAAAAAAENDDGAVSNKNKNLQDTGFALPASVATVALPLSLTLAVTNFGNGDLTPALSVAGGLGSPFLYGVLPVWMAWNQRRQQEQARAAAATAVPSMVPNSSLAFLGVFASGMLGTELVEQVDHLAHAL